MPKLHGFKILVILGKFQSRTLFFSFGKQVGISRILEGLWGVCLADISQMSSIDI